MTKRWGPNCTSDLTKTKRQAAKEVRREAAAEIRRLDSLPPEFVAHSTEELMEYLDAPDPLPLDWLEVR